MSTSPGEVEASDAGNAIEFLRTRSLATVIEAEIERLILTGALPPGSRLNEKALSARLSVSRGPVREACRKLQQAGLLDIVVNRGMFVRSLDVEQALELKDIRAALVPLVARKATAAITRAEIDELSLLVGQMNEPARNGDLVGYFPLNLEFHAKLLEFTRSPRLTGIYLSMNKELQLYRRQSLMTARSLTASNREHRLIVAALRARDRERVTAAMLGHSDNARNRLIEASQAHQERAHQERAHREEATNGIHQESS